LLEDLVQETYLKLCANKCRLLRDFEHREPDAIYAFLKVVTASVVQDHFKNANAAKRGYGQAPTDIETSGAVSSFSNQHSMDRKVLLEQIDQHISQIVAPEELPRKRLISWLYYRCGLSANDIASLPNVGLTTKGVQSVILRLTRSLQARLAEHGALQAKEISSSDHEGYVEA
jgi:RNA polymerase sigma-70 factor, ECF subfamily